MIKLNVSPGTKKIRNQAAVSGSEVLTGLFPTQVVAAEFRGDFEASLLYPEEHQYVLNAAPNRAREFAAGRACARYALASLGVFDFPLHVGSDRMPRWPDGVIGSITHTHSYCGVVVARRTELQAIGLDAEVIGGVGADLWPEICTPNEVHWLETFREPKRSLVATLLFCAKEAFYKCQYPLTREWLDFRDVFVEPNDFDPTQGLFAVNVASSATIFGRIPLPIHGKFARMEQILVAGLSTSNSG